MRTIVICVISSFQQLNFLLFFRRYHDCHLGETKSSMCICYIALVAIETELILVIVSHEFIAEERQSRYKIELYLNFKLDDCKQGWSCETGVLPIETFSDSSNNHNKLVRCVIWS